MPFGIGVSHVRKVLQDNMLYRISDTLITVEIIFAELCLGEERTNSVPTAYEKAKKMSHLAWQSLDFA